jgi:tetratricopeptide (TPR) repeat protein
MMKQLVFGVLLLASINSFSQKSNVASAAEYYKKYHDLQKAKEAIDLASQDESTSNDPKMWYYRGAIYLAISKDKELVKTYPDAVSVAATSFINCLKTDKGKDVINYTDSCNRYLWTAGFGLYNKGYDAYKSGDLASASKFFNQVFDVIPYDKENNLKRNNITVDVVNKMLYLVAKKGNDTEQQKVYLQKLIDARFNEPAIYASMSRLYLEQKDTAKALSYIESGKKIFEDYLPLMEMESNIYIAQGKIDELITKLGQDIEVIPDNEMLYYRRGLLHQNKGNTEKAEADYKKAIELKPDFLDATYSLGILYFNQAVDLTKAANAAKTNDEAVKGKEKYEAKFKQAQPYFEKAKELNAKKTEEDLSLYSHTLNSLKQIYVRTNQMEKYNEVKAELEKK